MFSASAGIMTRVALGSRIAISQLQIVPNNYFNFPGITSAYQVSSTQTQSGGSFAFPTGIEKSFFTWVEVDDSFDPNALEINSSPLKILPSDSAEEIAAKKSVTEAANRERDEAAGYTTHENKIMDRYRRFRDSTVKDSASLKASIELPDGTSVELGSLAEGDNAISQLKYSLMSQIDHFLSEGKVEVEPKSLPLSFFKAEPSFCTRYLRKAFRGFPSGVNLVE